MMVDSHLKEYAKNLKRLRLGAKRKPMSGIGRKNISEGLMGLFVGEKNHKWKGDNVGYYALHQWISKNWGKANKCQKCETKERIYERANITGIYNRKKENRLMLCRQCHHKFDDIANKGWITRKHRQQFYILNNGYASY